ncbi:MAG: hypothetical protein QOJ50_1663 [Cryptosporangiaceae bacterium]|nr:hypothetical protein [Cryptosporangiaceae bacterium]
MPEATVPAADPPIAPADPREHWWARAPDPVPPLRRLMDSPYARPLLVTAATSLVLCVAFLLLPLAGTDLSAQVARGHFFDVHGFVPIDFRWYGGVYPFGYSAFTGPLNALLGSRGVGATSCVVSAVAFAWLLVRVGARRPTLGGVLGAMVGVFNLVSGRTTFAMGIAFGMLALCAIVLPRSFGVWRYVLAGVLAAMSSAGSPVAGVFTGLCGTALILAGRRLDGLVLGAGAGLALLPPALLFRDGGQQPFSEESMKVTVAVCAAVFFVIPRQNRALRIGALLAGLATIAAYYLPTPVGSNVIRLPIVFAAPVAVAFSALDNRWLAGLVAAICWWQPPLVPGDLGNAGDRAAQRLYHQPLIDELERRGPVGRIEVVPLRDHWESTFVADAIPIARGWLRQVDVERNAIFYNDTLTPATYLQWLYDNAVYYVALPRATKLDFAGREEAALIEADLPYLKRVWESSDWTLYQVIGRPAMVDVPGRLLSSSATGVRFDVPVATDLTVRVRWSEWLVLRGPSGCLRRLPKSSWTEVSLKRAGTYTLTSAFGLPNSSAC